LKVKVWSQAECLDYDPEVEKQICAGGEKGNVDVKEDLRSEASWAFSACHPYSSV
jgi:hypothetical protein